MKRMRWAALAAVVLMAACADEPVGMTEDSALLSVSPAGGTVKLDGKGLVLTFTHAMPREMERYMVLHEGAVTGPVVAGAWSWNADGRTATFAPTGALKAATQYTLHVGGGMMDASGMKVDLAMHAAHHGGSWATGTMMSGGGMMGGGMMGGGMMSDSAMMGPGWRHENGSYGMVFTFTTA